MTPVLEVMEHTLNEGFYIWKKLHTLLKVATRKQFTEVNCVRYHIISYIETIQKNTLKKYFVFVSVYSQVIMIMITWSRVVKKCSNSTTASQEIISLLLYRWLVLLVKVLYTALWTVYRKPCSLKCCYIFTPLWVIFITWLYLSLNRSISMSHKELSL